MRVTFEGTVHEVLDQIEAFTKGIIDQWSKPLPQKRFKRKVEIDPVPPEVVIIEKPEPTPCQGHAVEQKKAGAPEDLLGAVMALVNGDQKKKDKLMGVLAAYDARTVGGVAADKRDAFWRLAQYELGGE